MTPLGCKVKWRISVLISWVLDYYMVYDKLADFQLPVPGSIVQCCHSISISWVFIVNIVYDKLADIQMTILGS